MPPGRSMKKHNKPTHKKTKNPKATTKKQVAKIAKAVVINNQEMRRRESLVYTVKYTDGVGSPTVPSTVSFNGLSARSPANIILNPLNYGWEGPDSINESGSEPNFENPHFNGKGIHPRYLKTKLLFKFPKGDAAIEEAMRLQLVWGFVKKPFMLTPYTTPKADEATLSELKTMLYNQIGREFDSPLDQLKFNVKRPNNYYITGRRWIKPDRRHRIGAPQNYVLGADGAPDPRSTGGPPQIKEVISWKMGKQWRLQKSGDLEEEDENIFYYNNENFIPFFLIYNPDFANLRQDKANYEDDNRTIKPGMEGGGGATGQPVPEENRIQVQHNSCMWYNDA